MAIQRTQKMDAATTAQQTTSHRQPPAAQTKQAAAHVAAFQESPARLAQMAVVGKAQVAKEQAALETSVHSPAAAAKCKNDMIALHGVYKQQAQNALKNAKPGAATDLWKDAIAQNDAGIAVLKAGQGSRTQRVDKSALANAQVKVAADKVHLAGPGGKEQAMKAFRGAQEHAKKVHADIDGPTKTAAGAQEQATQAHADTNGRTQNEIDLGRKYSVSAGTDGRSVQPRFPGDLQGTPGT